MFREFVFNGYHGMIGVIEEQVNISALDIGQTPQDFNGTVFGMVRQISNDVIVPIAAIVLTYIACYELIQMIIQGNNFQQVGTVMIFKWFIKTAIGVFMLSHSFEITMAFFDLGSFIMSETHIAVAANNGAMDWTGFRANLDTMGMTELFAMVMFSSLISIALPIMGLMISVIIQIRMFTIYLTISLAPIPFATFANKEWGQLGTSYLKNLASVVFQGFLMLLCMAIYDALTQGVLNGADVSAAVLQYVAYSVLLCIILTKTSKISASIFGAH
jgi:hypothetical protein